MGATCSECGAATSGRAKSGLCRPCGVRRKNQDPDFVAKRAADLAAMNRNRRKPRPHCACGSEISMGAARCRPCNMREVLNTPAVKAKSAASLAKLHQTDPEFHERHKASAQRGLARVPADPAHRAKLAENGRRVGPINVAATRTPAARAKAARSLSRTKLAHIPLDQRDLYRSLMAKGFSAAEREQMVCEQAETDRQRAPRLVRQSEEQMRARDERRRQEAY